MQNSVISALEHLRNNPTRFPWERVQQKAFMDHYLQPPGWERMFWSFKLFRTRFLTFHLYLFHRHTTQTPWFVVDNTVSQHCHSHCISGLKTLQSARLDLVTQEHHNWDIFRKTRQNKWQNICPRRKWNMQFFVFFIRCSTFGGFRYAICFCEDESRRNIARYAERTQRKMKYADRVRRSSQWFFYESRRHRSITPPVSISCRGKMEESPSFK